MRRQVPGRGARPRPPLRGRGAGLVRADVRALSRRAGVRPPAAPGLAHLAAYLLVTALACLGYGAVFLALSLVFKNPIVPAVVVLLWEGINGVLPVWLKRFSVTYYLKPLFPVELPVEGISGLFTVVAEPVPPWLAVAGLVLFAGAVVAVACWRIRYAEVSYSTE